MRKNQSCIMTEEAIENYGEEYDGVIFVITSVASNKNQHPGYDEGVFPQKLYDLKIKETGEDLQFSLYDWELKAI